MYNSHAWNFLGRLFHLYTLYILINALDNSNNLLFVDDIHAAALLLIF